MTASDQQAVVLTGVDVQSIRSFREHSEPVADGVRDRVFTDAEREYCESTNHPDQHYAARWAAKEAFIKLLPADSSVQYWDVAVEKAGPKPVYRLPDETIEELCACCNVADYESLSLDLSLSHDRDADVAMAHTIVMAHPAIGPAGPVREDCNG